MSGEPNAITFGEYTTYSVPTATVAGGGMTFSPDQMVFVGVLTTLAAGPTTLERTRTTCVGRDTAFWGLLRTLARGIPTFASAGMTYMGANTTLAGPETT